MTTNLTQVEESLFDNSYRFWSSPTKNVTAYASPNAMNVGERVCLTVTEEKYIIVEKISGTVLKRLLSTDSVIQNLIRGRKYKFMFIVRTKHPMFLNTSNDMMYFSDAENADAGRNIWYTGHYNTAIIDTDKYCDSPSDVRNNYYMIAYTGGNVFDGTIQYCATKDLRMEEEKRVRIAVRDIIHSIVDMYKGVNATSERLRKPTKQDIHNILNDIMNLIVFLVLSNAVFILALIYS